MCYVTLLGIRAEIACILRGMSTKPWQTKMSFSRQRPYNTDDCLNYRDGIRRHQQCRSYDILRRFSISHLDKAKPLHVEVQECGTDNAFDDRLSPQAAEVCHTHTLTTARDTVDGGPASTHAAPLPCNPSILIWLNKTIFTQCVRNAHVQTHGHTTTSAPAFLSIFG
jgi:hypothetical protein